MPRSAVLLLVLAACAAPADGGFYLDSADAERPRVRYDDGQVSRNDTCMVRLGRKLAPMSGPIYVNGSPVGFC